MRNYLHHYISGRWVDSDSAQRHDVLNPATEHPCAVAVLGSHSDVDRAVAAASQAAGRFAQTSVAERLGLLERIIAGYEARLPDIAAIISEEMGAPISFAIAAQAASGLDQFKAAARALLAFAWEEQAGGARIVHEAVGVVGLITPWNWPINQIAAKVGPCIAAGNTIILKPSEECPGSAVILAEIMHKAGVPAGVFNLVLGDGLTVGAAIARHPGIDMVSITGSTAAGIAVAEAAAPTVKRVHQELGGKAPNIVLPATDLGKYLADTLQGVLRNSGQTCVAPTRLLVQTDQVAEVEAFAAALFTATAVDRPDQPGDHIGPVINKAQFDKIQKAIATAIAEGAAVIAGGLGRPQKFNAGYYVRPTVLSGVTPDMGIYRDEVFGPVATISQYTSIEEAIAMANDTEYGLSATITGDPVIAREIARKLRTGLVTINSWGPLVDAPFGGYKKSGNGREGGVCGLRDFLEVKTIVG